MSEIKQNAADELAEIIKQSKIGTDVCAGILTRKLSNGHRYVIWTQTDFETEKAVVKAKALRQPTQSDALHEALREAAIKECEIMEPDDEGWSEWVHPLPNYIMECCGCGLQHEMETAIAKAHDLITPTSEGEDKDHVIIFRMRRI